MKDDIVLIKSKKEDIMADGNYWLQRNLKINLAACSVIHNIYNFIDTRYYPNLGLVKEYHDTTLIDHSSDNIININFLFFLFALVGNN